MQVDYWKRGGGKRGEKGGEEASRQLPDYIDFAIRDSDDELTST